VHHDHLTVHANQPPSRHHVKQPADRRSTRAHHRGELGLRKPGVEHDALRRRQPALGEAEEQLRQPTSEVEEDEIAVLLGEPSHEPVQSSQHGVEDERVAAHQLVGQAYRFLLTGLSGETLWRTDPYAREMRNSNGDCVIRGEAFDWGRGSFAMPGWDDLVVYELHVGTFHHGPGRGLREVTAKLPYLAGLDVTAVLVLPPAEFPGESSWGYNSSSIFTVETARVSQFSTRRAGRSSTAPTRR
jgi:hypothetical protein